MPELPEVETVRRGLQRSLCGEVIAALEILHPPAFRGDPTALVGRRVEACDRRGKMLCVGLSGEWSLLIHLRMTGQMLVLPAGGGMREGGGYPSESLLATLPNRHTRLILTLESGTKVFFNDQRTFGFWKLLPDSDLATEPFLSKLGPEPWDEALTAEAWEERLGVFRRRAIKAALLDQSLLAGVGNIYADEALFVAAIHPTTVAGSLSSAQCSELLRCIREVLERGIAFGGVTARDYVNSEGLKGRMQEQLNVYQRGGEACKVCQTAIQILRVAGRGTHICPTCQPVALEGEDLPTTRKGRIVP